MGRPVVIEIQIPAVLCQTKPAHMYEKAPEESQILYIHFSPVVFKQARELLQPFSDKCLDVFNYKGLAALRNWSRTTEREPEPVTIKTRPSPVLTRHRIITEGTKTKLSV